METFVGLDVSLKETSVCILNQEGTRVFEGKVASGCGFRRSQPSIPIETSHLFRLKPARHSDGSQPGWRYDLRAATFGSGASRLVKSGGFRGAQFAQ